MPLCPNCEKEYLIPAKFCPNCGFEQVNRLDQKPNNVDLNTTKGSAEPEMRPNALSSSRVWGAWPSGLIGVIIMGIYWVVPNFVAIISAWAYAFHYSNSTFVSLIRHLENTSRLFAAGVSQIGAIACIGLVALFIKSKKGYSIFEYLGFNRLTKRAFLRTAIVILPALILMKGIEYGFRPFTVAENGSLLRAYAGYPVLVWAGNVFVSPLFEEILNRGFLFRGFSSSFLGIWGAIILTSLAFALVHVQYNIYGLAMIFCWGIVLGTVRFWTKSLWSSIAIHIGVRWI
jgi:uncharacterized protein